MSLNHLRNEQTGATIIEALVAVLIFSIGILAVVGMQAVSVRAVADSKNRADASFLANQALGRLWGDPANLSGYAEVDATVEELPNGKRTIAVNGQRVTVTISWQAPGEPEARQFVAESYINVN